MAKTSKHDPKKKPRVKGHGSLRTCPKCNVAHSINEHRHHGKDSYKQHHNKNKKKS